MANEITYQSQIYLRNGSLVDTYSSGSKTATQSVAGLVRNVQNITTVAGGEALDLGSVTTPGWAVFINMDTADYVEIGSYVGGTFYPFIKLLPGECVMCRLGIAAPYALANTTTVDLFYIIYEA